MGTFDIVADNAAPLLDGAPFTLPEAILPRAGTIVAYSDAGLDPASIIGSSGPLPAGRHRNVSIAVQAMETSGTLYLVLFVDTNGDGVAGSDSGDPLAAWDDGRPIILGIPYEAAPAVETETLAAIDGGSGRLQLDGRSMTIPSVTLGAPGFVAAWGAQYGPIGEPIGLSEYLPAGTWRDVPVTFPSLLATSQPLAVGVMRDDPEEGRPGRFESTRDRLVQGPDGAGVWVAVDVVVVAAKPDPAAERFLVAALPEPDALGPEWAPLGDEHIAHLTRTRATSEECVAFNEASLALNAHANATRTAHAARAYFRQLPGSAFAEVTLSVQLNAFPGNEVPRSVIDLYRQAFSDGTLERCLQEGATGPVTAQSLVRIDPSLDPGEDGAAFAYGWTNEHRRPFVSEQYLLVRGDILVHVVFSAPGADPATVARLVAKSSGC